MSSSSLTHHCRTLWILEISDKVNPFGKPINSYQRIAIKTKNKSVAKPMAISNCVQYPTSLGSLKSLRNKKSQWELLLVVRAY